MTDFTTVTEVAGEEVSGEQIERLAHRYYWAGEFCRGRDVLELACGSGQGLGYLAGVSSSLVAGDICEPLVERARAHYGERVRVMHIDAQTLPFEDASFDVVILFEALYYLPDASRFVQECRRVLRPGGKVLIATANKDLYDFSPSPYSHVYYGVAELGKLFGAAGFACEYWGSTSTSTVSWRQRVLRPVKAVVSRLNLIPKTMAAKKLLKRIVFGRLQRMPAEITQQTAEYSPPSPLAPGHADREFKVLYLAATRLN